MNNEEKILQLLVDMKTEMTEMKADIFGIKTEMTEMKADISGIKTEMTEMKADISGIKIEMTEMKADISSMKSDIRDLQEGQRKLEQSVSKIEHEQGTKIAALFDGYTLRGDQIGQLKEHLDERLDAIQNDLSYVVGKVAQHDRNIVHLNKMAR